MSVEDTCIGGSGKRTDPANGFKTTQGEYTTKTYTACYTDVKIEVLIVADTAKTAKFKVNGETTDALSAGNSSTLSDNSKIKVIEVLPKEGSEAVGADQVTFTFDCSAAKKMCSYYCGSNNTAKCPGTTTSVPNCGSVGCNTTCWGFWSVGGSNTKYYNNGAYHGLCNAYNPDVCVGKTGQPTDRQK
jgi:hypothetical protein